MNTILQICITRCYLWKWNDLLFIDEWSAWMHSTPSFDQPNGFSISGQKFGNGWLFHILMTYSFQVTTHLQYGFHFKKYIAQRQIPNFAVIINKVAVTINKVIVTISFVRFHWLMKECRFYQPMRSVTINMPKKIARFLPENETLGVHMRLTIHTYC